MSLFAAQEALQIAGRYKCAVVNEAVDTAPQESPKALGATTRVPRSRIRVVGRPTRFPDAVLDPAFGGGVFLRAACKRLREIGGDPSTQVFGVELDAMVNRRIGEKLHEDGVAPANLLASDFFATGPEGLSPSMQSSAIPLSFDISGFRAKRLTRARLCRGTRPKAQRIEQFVAALPCS